MVFNFIFNIISKHQCKYPRYVRGSFTRTPKSILSEPLAAFSHSQCGNNSEWGMNPVAMTITNPRKGIGLALIEPTTSYSRVLCITMCYMSPASLWMNHRLQHQCLYLQTIPKKILCFDPLPNNPDLLLFTKRPDFGLVPIGCICRWHLSRDVTQKLKFVSVRIENMWKKVKMLVNSIFSFNYPIINLDQSKNLLFSKE